jgi:hypothetical protein
VTELDTSESWKTDWARLEEAVHAAIEYGEPFDLALYRTRTVSTRMKTRTLTGTRVGGGARVVGREVRLVRAANT